MKRRRKTAGEQSLKALSDSTKYNGIEVAEAQLVNIPTDALSLARKVSNRIGENEFFVVMLRIGDPLLINLKRQQLHIELFLPSPRPEQAVFLYNKCTDTIKFIWSLPPAKVMAAISEATIVAKKWKKTKIWCDAFFSLSFWHIIRKMNNFDHLSEIEYLQLHREELIQAGCQESRPVDSDPFDFSKIMTNKVISPQDTLINEDILDSHGQTKSFNRNICT